MTISVSMDLDPLWCYRKIFGLDLPQSEHEPDPVTTLATERFCDLMDTIGIRGTIFVVGVTLEQPSAAAAIKKAVDQVLLENDRIAKSKEGSVS